MIQWTRARAYIAFERRKAKVPRTITPERPVQVATILTWTPTTRLQLVQQAGVLGTEEALAVRLITPRMVYPRRFHRARGGAGSCNLPLRPLHLSRQLSHLRRSKHIKLLPLFLTCSGFVAGSTPHFHPTYSPLLPESLGSCPPSMQMKRSIWMNTGILIGSPCGRKSSANSFKSRRNRKSRVPIRSGLGSCYGS